MNFYQNPLKSISVSGDFSQTQLSKKIPYDYCGVNYGNWEIALSDFSYFGSNAHYSKVIVEIATNFVNGVIYSDSGALTLKNITLLKFEIPENTKSGLITFPLRWFVINNVSDTISLYLVPWPKEAKIYFNKKTIIEFTVLLRRIN